MGMVFDFVMKDAMIPTVQPYCRQDAKAVEKGTIRVENRVNRARVSTNTPRATAHHREYACELADTATFHEFVLHTPPQAVACWAPELEECLQLGHNCCLVWKRGNFGGKFNH